MAVNMKFYLTSLEPNLAQTIYSQSLGGYISTSLLYPEVALTKSVGLYNDWLEVEYPSDIDVWQLPMKCVNVGNEIMIIKDLGQLETRGIQVVRSTNNKAGMHIRGDLVRGLYTNGLFNNVFNEEYKQYRCISVKNEGISSDPSGELIAHNVRVYLYQNSRDRNTSLRIALEIPQSQYTVGESTNWSSSTLTNTSLIGVYDDNYFKEAYMRIVDGPNIGQKRIISSFDSLTGIFVFYDSLPVDYSSGYKRFVQYTIDPSPAQRIKTGTDAPIVGGGRVSNFSTIVGDKEFAMKINVEDETGKGDLNPNDIFYIWIERETTKGCTSFDNDNIIINLTYS